MEVSTNELRVAPRAFSGTGNLFAIVDAIRGPTPHDPAQAAIALCTRRAAGRTLDGILIVRPGSSGADCTMEIYNADGSRAETCGNGLRCVAKYVVDERHVRGRPFTIANDAGLATAEVELENGRVVRARVGMRRPSIGALHETLDVDGTTYTIARVDMGNPHCVLVVADERSAPVASLGAKIEAHARFPRGTNVEFLAARDGAMWLRVWERGVGETQACGSGACAAAAVAVERGLARFPVRLALPGGELVIDRSDDGSLVLGGAVEEIEMSAGDSRSRAAGA